MSKTCTCAFPFSRRILKLPSQKGIEAAGEPSKAKAQKAAFAAETEAYQDSSSLVSLAGCYYHVISISVNSITAITVVKEISHHVFSLLRSLLRVSLNNNGGGDAPGYLARRSLHLNETHIPRRPMARFCCTVIFF